MRITKTTNLPLQTQQLYSDLHNLLTQIKSTDQAAAFCESLLSPSEHLMLAKRMMVLKMLHCKEPYTKITKTLGVSSATISSVAAQKETPGAKFILDLLAAKNWVNKLLGKK